MIILDMTCTMSSAATNTQAPSLRATLMAYLALLVLSSSVVGFITTRSQLTVDRSMPWHTWLEL